MFDGGTLLCLIFAAGAPVALHWREIKARMTTEPAPATYTTFDCRGGVHSACETCSCSCHLHAELAQWVAHDTAMNARAERLGYTR